MGLVVLLRGVNVGGTRSFKPSQLPDAVPEFQMTNLGAAGTYVIAGDPDPEDVRARILDALPFETEVLLVAGDRLQRLIEEDPLDAAGGQELKRYLTVLATPPASIPPLPVDRPEEGPWQFRLVSVEDALALSLRRPEVEGRFYPNGTIEDLLGVGATTRGWRTVERIGEALRNATG